MLTTLTVAALLAAPTSLPIDEILARPLSPGSLALLVESPADPRAVERWAAGLRDARPEVRAAAARLARVGHVAALADPLRSALQTETDPAAARELRGALLTVSATDAEAVLADGQRRGGLGSTLLLLAQTRGPAALAAWPQVRSLQPTRESLAGFLTAAARSNPAALGPLALQAIRAQDASAWAAILEAQRNLHATADGGLLTAAVRAGGALAEAAIAHLVLSGSEAPEPVSEAIKESRTALQEHAVGAIALELLDRATAPAARDLSPLLAKLHHDGEEIGWLQARAVTRRLDEKERQALGELPVVPTDPSLAAPDLGDFSSFLRLAAGYPPGFVADTLAVSGCSTKKAQPVGGRVDYRPDGTTSNVVAFDDLGGGPSCLRAARALFASYVLPERARATLPGHDTLMVVADPEVLACSGETSPGPKAGPAGDDLPRRVGFSIQEPRKIHTVPPVYPTAEKAARVQGVVILEAVVNPTGCLSDLGVIRSVRPRLDLAALVAVAQWRYAPTLVNGRAVPVLMTITVNFRVN